MDGVENNQPGGPESSPGPNQGRRRWEAEEEAKEEQPQPEDEGSNSGVGGWTCLDFVVHCFVFCFRWVNSFIVFHTG